MENDIVDKKAENFLNSLKWVNTEVGDFALKPKEHKKKEEVLEESEKDLNLVYFEYDKSLDAVNTLAQGQWVISELGKYEISQNDQGLLVLNSPDTEPIYLPVSEVYKHIIVNITLTSAKGVFEVGDVMLDINDNYEGLQTAISAVVDLPAKLLKIYYENQEISSDFRLRNLDTSMPISLEVFPKEVESMVLKRSTNKDYSWYDKKFIIGFKTPAIIRINAIGFFRHYDNLPITYEFSAYEVDNSGNKLLRSSLSEITVINEDCDQSTFIKKVSIPPFMAYPEYKYLFYVYFGGDSNTRSYYANSCNETVTSTEGLQFRFTREIEEGHRSETSCGHIPDIYYDIYSPYI